MFRIDEPCDCACHNGGAPIPGCCSCRIAVAFSWEDELYEQRIDFRTELRFSLERHPLGVS